MPLDAACLFGSTAGWSVATSSIVVIFGVEGTVSPDTVNTIRAAFGGAGGFIGAMCIALYRKQTSRMTLVAILMGTMLGIFVPPIASRYFDLRPEESGLIGLILGLVVLGLMQAFSKVSDRLGRDGDRIVSQIPVVRDIIPPEQIQGPKP